MQVTPDTGNGDKTLSFVADANSGNARETSISITGGGGITKSLNISQNGVPKINMVEIGGYVFEIDRARRY